MNLKVAWIGDGNNVCNSLILSSGITGMEISVASPKGYTPHEDIVARARNNGGRISVMHDPSTP
jgi:ornithine carbamoyltransferase